MQWTSLPQGPFTGIDWSDPHATAGADPYLIWAEASRFAGCGGSQPEWLPVLLELEGQVGIRQLLHRSDDTWLKVAPAYVDAPSSLRFCSARVKRGFFDAMRPGGALAGMVKRLELGLPRGSQEDADRANTLPFDGPALDGKSEPNVTGCRGKVLAFIDDGFALAHANFVSDGGPRVKHFWRQDGLGKGRAPKELGYGHELAASDIAIAMAQYTYGGLVDEGAVYAELGLSQLGTGWAGGKVPFHALDTSVSHGTHVLDLGAGPLTMEARQPNLPPDFDAPPSWTPAQDDASSCSIVAVQLDYTTVKDSSGGSMNVHMLDALMYILARCKEAERIVVNISFGTLAGPHDGTSLLEAAMAQLIELLRGRLHVVVAAGNGYQLRTHANIALQPASPPQALHWRVQPDDTTPSFVELWISQGCEDVEIQITPPGRAALPPLKWGHSGVWLDGSADPVCALIYPRSVATGERGTCAMIAVAPTFSFDCRTTTAASGVWRIELTNTGRELAIVDAYIERDDIVIGTRSGARQSHFEDDPDLAYEQQYDMQAHVDDPRRATPIRRGGNFNSIATGDGVTSAGGRRITDETWARYSPRKPDPDDARAERLGVVKVPTEWAWSDENAAMVGLRAAGTRSGSSTRLAGTSDAAPLVARRKLNA